MKIGINTLSVTPYRGAGARTNLTNLVKNLGNIDNSNIYYLFISPINKKLFSNIHAKNIKKIEVPLKWDNRLLRFIVEQIFIPFYLKKLEIDILFSPGNIAIFICGCKQVLMLQGPLMIKEVRENYAPFIISKYKAFFYDLLLPPSTKVTDKIIVVSDDIKKRLLKQIHLDASKVKTIHEGASFETPTFNQEASKEEFERNILFISTLLDYKNADKLIEAFSLLKSQYDINYNLIIVGRDPGGKINKLKNLAEKRNIENHTIFKGQVSYEKIPFFYKNADVFVYPSSVESFGLPVLEAMACGTPVVASNRMSVPEIAGDAAVIVDPDNIEEMAEAIYRVITDENLREKLIRKGYERVREFSWEKTARETIKVFEEVANEK